MQIIKSYQHYGGKCTGLFNLVAWFNTIRTVISIATIKKLQFDGKIAPHKSIRDDATRGLLMAVPEKPKKALCGLKEVSRDFHLKSELALARSPVDLCVFHSPSRQRIIYIYMDDAIASHSKSEAETS